ncbi:MAG: hypothetical protein K0R33_1914 [Mycobacterium sp.]|jgi:hypothetical protein|nr:hypothetical protein [Mycobacterium sp.]
MSFDGSVLKYNFGQNHTHLDGLESGLADARALQTEVDTVFRVLAGVYTGQGAVALQGAHQQIYALMDAAANDMGVGNRHGREQQDLMQALDRANAMDL